MPTAIFVQDGDSIDYTPGANVASGDVVVQGDLIGIAKQPITANVPGTLAVVGIFEVPKASGTALAAGTIVYWDATNKRVTSSSSGNKLLGKVVRAASEADTTVRVKLTQ